MRTLARWHRRIGLVAAALVVLVTVTGLLLQHAATLGLPRQTVTNRALLSLYFSGDGGPALGFRSDGTLRVWRNGLLFADGTAPFALEARPLGIVATSAGPVVATEEALYLLTPQGALLERLDASLLPGRLRSIGRLTDGAVAVATERGTYTAPADFSTLTEIADETPEWSTPEDISPGALPAFVTAAAPGLPLDRILLDLHTGRLFGSAGVWIVNLGSLAFLVLALSGVVTALRRNGKNSSP